EHMRSEVEKYLQGRKENPEIDKDLENHYKGMKDMGNWLWNIYEREAFKRAKFFESQNHRRFIEKFFEFVEKRAADLGYRYSDVVLMDTSITDSGYILLKVVPRPGAQKILAETDE
ncbi:MAG: hypothetical protein KGL39_33920, partial [Patescibacteria group bacterium]|nr:hypothetical protein [Patescibacteria group bacterium]